ncbi:MAG TPA: thiol reductant ABC exporter subunit CydC [Gaiellaceae bacterium]|nr:thiol reductant ABC exporter subunit CydC [Gaiellaceae bacterium]
MSGTLAALWRLAPPPKGRLALSIVLGALAVIFGIGLMATAGYLIARAAERPEILSLSVAIVMVRFFGLTRPLARYLERLASHDLAFRVLARFRVRFYERIEPLAPAGLDAYRRGDLVSRMVGDVDALQGLYLRGLGPPLVAVGAGAVAVGVAVGLLPAAGAALALGLLVGGIAVPLVSGLVGRSAGRGRAGAQGHLSAELVELLRGAPELVVYGRADDALERVRAGDRVVARLARRDALAAGVGDGLAVLVAGLTTAAVLALAVAAHADGRLDRVLVAVLPLLALASFEAVAPLSLAARELSSTLAAGRRVLELAEREPTVRDPVEPVSLPARPTLALEHVDASYTDDGTPVLHDVDLVLEPGRSVALVGPSGAGKTTVVNILLRFLDPTTGRVTLGGRDLREYRQADVRRAVAVAGQDAYLFSTTIRENVRIGRAGASDSDVEDALRRARVWDWVSSLPEGVDTRVGEEGAQLSGGQRQRVALARALLSNAPVLVLDEPTAHLDPETAEPLVRDILAAADGRSVLLVTHRPEGLDLVDEVLELPGESRP